MRLTKYEVISFVATASIFASVFGFFLGYPNISTSMGAGSNAPSETFKNQKYSYAQPIDNLNGVNVYYNGKVGTVTGRSLTEDGYNLGLKYQCVEFIKRYYYEYYSHKMPDSYGHAKDFFDEQIPDGWMNRQRNLRQFTNGSISRPRTGDILVFGPTPSNKYGHIGIVAKSGRNIVEMIHQNAGPDQDTRVVYKLRRDHDKWHVQNDQLLGWLRRS